MAFSENVYIHIGPGHTGTTSLQESLFAEHSEINFFGKPYVNDRIKAFASSIHYSDGIDFDEAFAASVADQDILPNLDPDKSNVISTEGFSSVAPTIYGLQMADRSLIGQRLKKYFDDHGRIIISIHNQFSALQSQYVNLSLALLKKRILPPNFERLLLDGHPQEYTFYFSHYDYLPLITFYERLFGKDNVIVLPLESLAENTTNYAHRLCDFLNIEDIDQAVSLLKVRRNERHTTRAIAFERMCTIFGFPENVLAWPPLKKMGTGPVVANWVKQGKRCDLNLSNQAREKILKIYGANNAQLEAKSGLTLSKWGYPIA